MTSPRNTIGVRVRPNSHDFIRDLRADLASKHYTFYVTVGARTFQATKDVREWARTTLPGIQAHVKVHARTGPATAELQRWRAWQRTQGVTLGVDLDTRKAVREMNALRALADTLTIKVRTEQKVGARRRSVREEVAEAVKIAEAVEDASARVRRRATRRQGPPGAPDRNSRRRATRAAGAPDVKVGADTSGAQREIDALVNDVRRTKTDVTVGANVKPGKLTAEQFAAEVERRKVKQELDIDLKRARLEMTKLQLEARRRKLEMKVDVQRSSADRVLKLMDDISRKSGSFMPIRSLDVGPFNLGKPTGLLGTLTTLTALAGGLPAIISGVSALSQGLISLGAAATTLPGALAGVATSVGVMKLAFSGVGETIGAMFDVWNEGASDQRSAARTLVTAHNSYRNALVDEKRAQENVADARREALGEMRSLNNELRNGVLNEAQAILDVQKARDRYAEAAREGFDNETERLQLQLDIAKAEQGLIDTRESSIDLQQRVNEANVKQVEGSDRVQDALEAQTRAAQSTAAALEALNEAQGGGTAMTAFQDALGGLSPNAQEFIMTLSGMKDELLGYQSALQDVATQNLGPAAQGLFDSLMPIIEPGTTRIAAALNDNIMAVFDSLGSTDGQSIITRILGGTGEAQEALTGVIDPLVRGIGTLVAAGAENLPRIVDLMGRLMDRFAKFIETADEDGSLDEFMVRGVDALENVTELAINLIKIVNDLGSAFGGDILKNLADMTARWHEFLSSEEGQAKLQKFIEDARDVWNDWLPVLQDLPELFQGASNGAKALIDGLMPFINLITSALEKWPGLVSAFVFAWGGLKIATTILSPFLGVIKGVSMALGGLMGIIRTPPAWIAKLLGMGPNQFGIPPVAPAAKTPGPTGIPAMLGAPGASTVARGGGVASIIVGGGLALGTLLNTVNPVPQDYSVSVEDAAAFVTEVDAKLPDGLKVQNGRITVEGMAAQGNKAAKWAQDAQKMVGGGAQVEFAKRWAWLVENRTAFDDPNFEPPPSYMSGGFTPWGRKQGKTVELHGQEYVQPAGTVDFYGVDAMRAIHEKRVPPGLIKSFQSGGYNKDENPSNPIIPGLVDHATAGISSVASNVSSGIGSGPAPGPADAAATTPLSTNIMGVDVPLGSVSAGWPGGTAPIGLGGGEDGFDIRNFGIGPGPAGSTPSDWASWGADFAASTAMKFGEALLSGALDFFGLGGLMDNPMINAGKGLAGHFATAASKDGKGVQGPGAAQTNADVSELLALYGGMPTNPAYPDFTMMPSVFGLDGSALAGGAGGSALAGAVMGGGGRTGSEQGLQVKTIAIKRFIEANFPQIQTIGGYRADALQWHPNGRALDVMMPTGDTRKNPASKALGDAIYQWAIGPQGQAMGVYPAGTLWQTMAGGNHFDHVHIALLDGGGYPDGMGPASPPAANAAGGHSPSATQVPWGGTPGESAPAGPTTTVRPPNAAGPPLTYTAGDAKGTPLQYDSSGNPVSWKVAKPLASTPAPKAPVAAPKNADAIGALLGIPSGKFDVGGWMPTGVSVVQNDTGSPELAVPMNRLQSFANGGLFIPQGAVPPPPTPIPPAPVVQAKPRIDSTPAPKPVQTPQSPKAPLQPQVPPITPTAPPVSPEAHGGTGAAPGPQREQRPYIPGVGQTAPQVGADAYMHLHPAIRKGITSGASVLGNIAGAAASMGMMASGGGGAGSGGVGALVAGGIQQAGKIIENAANVGASFLVGNITGGTTENPYGVTQRGNIPSGGTKVVDASSVHNGDIITNNLDEYFARTNRRESQRAQAGLGRWGNA